MKIRFAILSILAAIMLCASCIENDIPYPVVVPTIKSMSVEGAKTVTINNNTYSVVIDLVETTDRKNVNIESVVYGDSLTKSKPSMVGIFDLTSPQEFILTTYNDYKWVISSTQTIERYFTVSGQVGTSTIDADNARVLVYVSKKTRLDDITVTSMKLGPEGITTYSKTKEELKDFTTEQTVDVTVRGETVTWKIYIEQTETTVQFKSLDPWTRVVWLTASGVEGYKMGFCWRQSGQPNWNEVADVKVDGGMFAASLDGLQPLTSYDCYAYCGEDKTEVKTFITEGEQLIPNSGFEIYSNAESEYFYSFYDPKSSDCPEKWWDSGNKGSTTVGSSASICNPDTEDKAEGNASARLNSKYVVIKFAAGNIFTGEFAELVGIEGGKVNFGRPWTLRPRKLKFSVKYIPGKIDNINGYPSDDPVTMGDPDRCHIYIALGDWSYKKYYGTPTCPVQVNTTDKSTFFNPNGENVIAYAEFISNKSTDGWQEIELPLAYVSTSRVPTHIIISCAASKLGDYFTGSSTSTLWVDNFRLEY